MHPGFAVTGSLRRHDDHEDKSPRHSCMTLLFATDSLAIKSKVSTTRLDALNDVIRTCSIQCGSQEAGLVAEWGALKSTTSLKPAGPVTGYNID